MTFNKTITTNTKEQIKSAVILTLVVGMVAFIGGVQYQKHATVSVENKVVVQAQAVTAPAETAEVKK